MALLERNKRLSSSVAVFGHSEQTISRCMKDEQTMLRTVFSSSNIVIDMMCNLQVPRHHHQTLFFRKRVQQRESILDIGSS